MRAKANIYKSMSKPFWVWTYFILFFTGHICAQNEWVLNKYPGDDVRLLAETYDGGIIVQALNWQFNSPVILAKYSVDGEIIWEKSLQNNVWDIQGATATKDSGFIIALQAFSTPVDSINWDSLGIIELMKFDKCAHLQWARYVKSVFVDANPQPTSVIENNGDLYLCCLGINGYDDYNHKCVTILKFSQGGLLLDYRSYNGGNAMIYQNQNKDTIYLSKEIDAPIGSSMNVVYSFSGIHSIDTSLNTIDSVVIGYYNKILNGMGSLIIENNSVLAASGGYSFNNGNQEPMFTEWNKSLGQIGGFMYDSIKHFDNMYPAFAGYHNDSTIICYQIYPQIPDTNFGSLRLYDKNFHELKETLLNKTFFQFTTSLLELNNGQFIVSELYYNPQTGNYIGTSFFLFDRAISPIPWPTKMPAKGYDWACNVSVPDSETINVDSVATPVYVKVDTSIVNWQPLSIPPNAVIGKVENGWLVWPQPTTNGSPLYLQLQSNSPIQDFQGLNVIIYNMEGKQVLETMAIYQAASKWVIPSLNLPCAGVYMAELRNKRTGVSLGNIKVVIE